MKIEEVSSCFNSFVFILADLSSRTDNQGLFPAPTIPGNPSTGQFSSMATMGSAGGSFGDFSTMSASNPESSQVEEDDW